MTPGINIAGLEWNPSQPPSAACIAYYLDKGFGQFRIPITWEVLQPTLYGALDPSMVRSLDAIVTQVSAKPGAVAILDMHNYMRRGDKIVGESEVTAGHLIDVWTKLAGRYVGKRQVWFGLMNEPHDVDAYNLAVTLRAVAQAIRATAGDENAILIPGTDWCNGQRWLQSGNDVLHDRIGPVTNTIVEVHQYPDAWGAGQSATAEVGSGRRLDDVTAWAKRTGRRLFLGETACGSDAASMAEMATLLATVRGCSNWVGACWWSSLGFHPDPNRRWFNLDPLNGQDRPQIKLLTA